MSIAAETAASVTLAPTLVTASRIPRPGAAALPSAVSLEIVLLKLMIVSNNSHSVEIVRMIEIYFHCEAKEKLIIAMILIVLRSICTVKQKRESWNICTTLSSEAPHVRLLFCKYDR